MKAKEDTIRTVFARNVKAYRMAMQYSQEKLAEKSGLSVQTIKDVEASRRWASDVSLSKLAKALNVAEFQLLMPEKFNVEEGNTKFKIRAMISLKNKIKVFMDEQFENTIKGGAE
jgi:transcriptional regulator with XRE-family HTH domain